VATSDDGPNRFGVFLLVPPLARSLGHAAPPTAAALVALLAVPAPLMADTAHKRWPS
jgi:hypothetical protein